MEFISKFINLYNILIFVLLAILIIIYNLNKKLRKHDSQILILEKDLNIQYEMILDLLDENEGFDLEYNINEQEISSNEKILLEFQNYLKKNNYSEFTPSGYPSTVYDYSKSRLLKICIRENITLQELVDNISKFVKKYDIGGEDSDFGAKSNRAYINALKCFQRFLYEYNSFEDLFFNEEKNNISDTKIIFKKVYDSIFNDIKSGKIKSVGETQLCIVNNRIGFGGNKKSESKQNMNLLFDYFIRTNKTNVTKYDKDDWFSLISKLTNGRTKTIDYIYYKDFIQELLNRYYKK